MSTKILRSLIATFAFIGISFGLCEWSFSRGVAYQKKQEAAAWDGFFMDALGYRQPVHRSTPPR